VQEIDYKYYDDRINELPKETVDALVGFVKRNIEYGTRSDIKNLIRDNGLIKWALPFHHDWGMDARNEFRALGYKDVDLPSKNWDDYYIQIIEIAIGERKV
jgi:hypothetical protein